MANTNSTTVNTTPSEVSEEVVSTNNQATIVHTLLNYEAPHYVARFTILGCPPGLEVLDKYEQLLINRRFQNTMDLEGDKRLLAYSQFDVKNSRGMQLYIAVEEVSRRSLSWFRDARLFEVVDVSLPDGTKLGSIQQKMSFSSTTFQIYNASGKCIMICNGVLSDGILDVTFPEEEEPIAMIETLMNDTEAFDFYRVIVPPRSYATGITFFKNFLTPEEKALLLSVTILLDYITLKPTSDYPHFCEVIPDDYQEFPMPYAKMYRDGSRELLVLLESRRKRGVHPNTSKLKGRWGCCIWCGRLMCVCFSLGIRRNAIRCISLLIASILLSIFIAFLLIWLGNFIIKRKFFS